MNAYCLFDRQAIRPSAGTSFSVHWRHYYF